MKFRLIALTSLVCALPGLLLGDAVVLKNGTLIDARSVKENDDGSAELDLGFQKVTIPADSISQIIGIEDQIYSIGSDKEYEEVKDASAEVAEDVWWSASANEDSLTGDYFGKLRSWNNSVETDAGIYEWSVNHTKFASGRSGQEKRTGADGIFEIEIDDGWTVLRKAILVQGKKDWEHKNSGLLDQVSKMETVAHGASAVVNYTQEGFYAAAGTVVQNNDGRPKKLIPAGEFFADVVECKAGRRGMSYDAGRSLILFLGTAYRLPVGDRLRVSVTLPENRKLPAERRMIFSNNSKFEMA